MQAVQQPIIQASIPNNERKTKKCRQTLLEIAKTIYYLHLLISFFSALVLIILLPKVRTQMSLTFALLIVYGFMLAWLVIINIIFVIIQREGCAVWCNRVIAKATIMIFPVFYIIDSVNQNFLQLLWVKYFMVYLLVISILLIIYQFYSCTWGHHEQPNYLYEPNNLDDHTNQIWEIRNRFVQTQLSKKRASPQNKHNQQYVS